MTNLLTTDSSAETFDSRQQTWTQDEILTTLRFAYEELRVPLNLALMKEWSERTGWAVPSQRTYTVKFGSWVDACEQAGVPHTKRIGAVRPGPQPVAADTCWAAARAFLAVCEAKSQSPTMDRYEMLARQQGWPSRNTLILRLNRSWSEVISQANRHRVKASPITPPHHRRQGNRPATVRQILAAIQAASGDNPGRLTTAAYHRWAATQAGDTPALDEIRVRFGSWATACKAAGVASGRPPWTSRSALAKLREAHHIIGEPFTGYRYRDFTDNHPEGHTFPTVDAAARIFGSWGAVCAKVGTPVARPRWDARQIEAAMKGARRAYGANLTMHAYRQWLRDESAAGRTWPTVETISRHLGSWRTALATFPA